MSKLQLVEMSKQEYGAYIENSLRRYIAEGTRLSHVTPEQARARGRSAYDSILPSGQQTEGQHFRKLITSSNEKIGAIWFAEVIDKSPPGLFIYDLIIEEARRGCGYGSLAMNALENLAPSFGAKEISLHVFQHNEGALKLYARLGYEATQRGKGGMRMRKVLETRSHDELAWSDSE